jgi:hypothetical protein
MLPAERDELAPFAKRLTGSQNQLGRNISTQ